MIWAEIRNDYEEEVEGQGRTVFVDAWETGDDNEEGQVIAQVFKNPDDEVKVKYYDERAKKDKYSQEVIQDAIKKLKAS